jgi:hypothetical protein
VKVYDVYLADLLMFSLLRARGGGGGAGTGVTAEAGALNDYPAADDIPSLENGGGGKRSRYQQVKRLDLRCYHLDGGWNGFFNVPKGFIVENVASNLENRKPVPQRYMDNAELLHGWPGGDPDGEGANGWIQVSHPLDGSPEVRKKHKSGLVLVRPGDYLLLELDASTAASLNMLDGQAETNHKAVETVVEAEVFFLISYQHMAGSGR